ncbi:DUF1062 domain-containing protein [Paucisalibacillus sp. EB02]|uniref:DUF1062 domain-containing protein n=1 Tax=Paucisalibacillus sp. EB02 TaxID=1347087 RepID=UPI0004B9DCC6|nr:DUF1062 domain-containing protein [Paucisalibacillus sp. EB02]
MSLNHVITYEIIAQETPKVIRNCRNCKRSTEYYCSDKFRVNANRKLVDIWLIYKCIHCENTWNYPIYSRVHVSRLDPILHQKYMNNDKETIWYHAFQSGKLQKLCDAVNQEINYEIKKDKFDLVSNEVTINICCKYDFGLRIDKLLAEIVGISRSQVKKQVQAGMLLLNPDVTMKDKVTDKLQITVKGNWHQEVAPTFLRDYVGSTT